MSGSLSHNVESVEALASKISTSKENFDSCISAIESANIRLASSWQGTASAAYTDNLTTQIEMMKKLSELLGETANYLNTAAATYREAEEANTLGGN